MIKLVQTSGIYHLKDVSVRIWDGVFSLTTIPQTIITASDKNILPSKVSLTELISSTIPLPPISFVFNQTQTLRVQCGKSANQDMGKLFECKNCGVMARTSKLFTKTYC